MSFRLAGAFDPRYRRCVDAPGHTPVLLDAMVSLLDPKPGETALDCTVGLGGHAMALAERIGPGGTLAINDVDQANLERSREALEASPEGPKVVAFRGNFAEAPRRMRKAGLSADLVIADLGFSSNQMEDARRGLSFRRDGPLDMRLDESAVTTAADLVNSLPEPELAEIIRDFGEEHAWRRVARKLVEARESAPIETTARFAQIVRSAVGGRRGGSHIDPATRTFQALRIAVNDELASLTTLLECVQRVAAMGTTPRGENVEPPWLAPGARVGVISFHSLEDRLVKRAFAELVGRGQAKAPSRKLIVADEREIAANPRSRSARLRVIRLRSEADDGD